MTPEEMKEMMASGGQDAESSRIGAIADMYAMAIRVFLQDPQKLVPNFSLDELDSQEKAEKFGETLAPSLLGLCIGLNMGIEPFLKEEGERRWLKRAKAKVLASTPPGITPDFSPNVIKEQGELHAQNEPCTCGHSYSDHTNKDKGPCSSFRCDCVHFDKKNKVSVQEGGKNE